jgi:hypothetical protein
MIGVKGCLTILELDIPLQLNRRGSSRFRAYVTGLRHAPRTAMVTIHHHHPMSFVSSAEGDLRFLYR